MALIGEGTYGKVYRPAFDCEGKRVKGKKVGKVFANKYDFQDELKMVDKVKEINSNHVFSIPFYESCPTNLQIIYADGGMDLYDYMYTHKPKLFWPIMRKMKYICMGIKLLIESNYVHQDIKLENIVFNDKKLYLIDFGLMTHSKDIYKHREFLTYDYVPFPPEYKHYAYKNKFEGYFYKNFYSEKLWAFIKSIYPDYKQDLLNIKTYPFDKIDIYSLGMVIVQLYRWYKKKDERIETLIRGMICFDPEKRWNINMIIDFISRF